MRNVWIGQGYGCDGPEVFTSPRKAYDYFFPYMSEKISYSIFLKHLRDNKENGTYMWYDKEFDISVVKKEVNPII